MVHWIRNSQKGILQQEKHIWSSELTDLNKVIAHNSFSVPVITPTVGVIDWMIDDIKQKMSIHQAENVYPRLITSTQTVMPIDCT